MEECLFCSIAEKKLPSNSVFEDSECIAFRDINPKAPVHILIVPKRHIASLAAAKTDDSALLGRLLYRAKLIAEQEGIDASGYKVVINTGRHGGQVVDHLHVHVLGGQQVQSIV